MKICPKCRESLYTIETAKGDTWYCSDCDELYTEDETVEGTPQAIRVDRTLEDDQCLLVGVDSKFYIGVIKNDDGTYHIDLHTPLGVFEEFDYCPEEDEDEDND